MVTSQAKWSAITMQQHNSQYSVCLPITLPLPPLFLSPFIPPHPSLSLPLSLPLTPGQVSGGKKELFVCTMLK